MRARGAVVVEAPPAQVLAVVTDFARYPAFVPGVRAARVVAREDHAWEVAFGVHLARRLDFTLRVLEHPPAADGEVRVSWSLVEGGLMGCEGAWTLRPLDGARTEAAWALDVQVQAFVPRVLSNTLERRGVPALLDAFRRQAEQRVG